MLERNGDHWAAPKIERWILRIVQNVEATLGMLNRGEINFLADYTGDAELVQQLVRRNRNIVMNEAVDVGFQFLAWNHRRPPFNDPAFRRALSAADRTLQAWLKQADARTGLMPDRLRVESRLSTPHNFSAAPLPLSHPHRPPHRPRALRGRHDGDASATKSAG